MNVHARASLPLDLPISEAKVCADTNWAQPQRVPPQLLEDAAALMLPEIRYCQNPLQTTTFAQAS